jgi:hypothetical protein
VQVHHSTAISADPAQALTQLITQVSQPHASSRTMTDLPKKGEDLERYHNPYLVERSTTGRAKCGVCRQLISKETLRIGEHFRGDDHGPSISWRHLGCVGRAYISTVETRLLSVEAAEGFRTLSADDQALTLRLFANDKTARAELKEEQWVAARRRRLPPRSARRTAPPPPPAARSPPRRPRRPPRK